MAGHRDPLAPPDEQCGRAFRNGVKNAHLLGRVEQAEGPVGTRRGGRIVAQGIGPRLRPFGKVAFEGQRAGNRVGAKARHQPVDQPRQVQRSVGIAVQPDLGGGQRLGRLGRQADQVEAKAWIQPVQPPLEQPQQMVGLAAGGGGGDADVAPAADPAPDTPVEPVPSDDPGPAPLPATPRP